MTETLQATGQVIQNGTDDVPAMFLGKWTLYHHKLPSQLNQLGLSCGGYAGYDDTDPNDPKARYLLCVDCTPGKWANIAFVLRGNRQLCFLMNNGKYVGYGECIGGNTGYVHNILLVNTLNDAAELFFSDADIQNLSTPFTSPIENT